MFKSILIFIVKIYQKCISPIIPARCRFYPTCSNYALESVKNHGALMGLFKSLYRVLRCNPFNPGGYDPACKE